MSGYNKISIEDIKKAYLTPKVVEEYGKQAVEIKLWKSEAIMANKYFRKDGYILDIGCGAGRTTIGLYRLGYNRITGLDLSEKMIGKACELSEKYGLNINFIQGNVLNLQFRDNTFDGALFSFNGIMQIPGIDNRTKAMMEIRRILKPGGVFIFTTHNDRDKNKWQNYWESEKKIWNNNEQDKRLLDFGDRMIIDKGVELYLHFPTQDEVKDCINKSGFTLVENTLRNKICVESAKVKSISHENRFWVVQKPTKR